LFNFEKRTEEEKSKGKKIMDTVNQQKEKKGTNAIKHSSLIKLKESPLNK